MSPNREKPHLVILPEDDANRQIANGFVNCQNINYTIVKLLPSAKGWTDVRSKLENELRSQMEKYLHLRVLLLIDYDNQYERRFSQFQESIPEYLKSRVFILGVKTEPEDLRKNLGMTFEKIGVVLTEQCPDILHEAWQHDLLIHNEPERLRLIEDVRHFLFL